MNLEIRRYDEKWPVGSALDVFLAFHGEAWRGHMLISMRDEGIPDRHDGQNQTRCKFVKIISILVGGLRG